MSEKRGQNVRLRVEVERPGKRLVQARSEVLVSWTRSMAGAGGGAEGVR